MSNNSSASASIPIPVFGLAFAVLLVLKLAGMAGASWGLANLSWFWVFFPLLLGFAAFALAMVFVFVAILFAKR